MLSGENLGYRIGNTVLLQDVSLHIAAGEKVVLLGPNGAGKSTLLRILSGELSPDAGQVRINDRALSSYSPHALAARRAVLTQETNIFGAFTAREIVQFGRLSMNETAASLERSCNEAMRRTETTRLSNRLYQHCSGGEKQRVQLARVVNQLLSGTGSPGATYLLLDEPTSALDPGVQVSVLRLVSQLAEEGIGILAILHDINVAAQFADRIVVLHEGAIAIEGGAQEILQSNLLEDIYQTQFLSLSHPSTGPMVITPL